MARAHGVRGELRIHMHDRGSETLFEVERVWVGGELYEIEAVRPAHEAVLVKLERVDDRDAAEALKGRPVEVERDEITLEEGEFLVADLMGCEVFDAGGRSLGRVVDILHGPQDLLVLRDERVERLMPLVPELLVEVDVEARRVVAAAPEDLPEEPIRPGRM